MQAIFFRYYIGCFLAGCIGWNLVKGRPPDRNSCHGGVEAEWADCSSHSLSWRAGARAEDGELAIICSNAGIQSLSLATSPFCKTFIFWYISLILLKVWSPWWTIRLHTPHANTRAMYYASHFQSSSPPPSGGDEGEGEDSSRSGVQRRRHSRWLSRDLKGKSNIERDGGIEIMSQELVKAQLNISPGDQKLMLRGKKLQEGTLLGDYNLREGDRLHLVVINSSNKPWYLQTLVLQVKKEATPDLQGGSATAPATGCIETQVIKYTSNKTFYVWPRLLCIRLSLLGGRFLSLPSPAFSVPITLLRLMLGRSSSLNLMIIQDEHCWCFFNTLSATLTSYAKYAGRCSHCEKLWQETELSQVRKKHISHAEKFSHFPTFFQLGGYRENLWRVGKRPAPPFPLASTAQCSAA